MKSEILSVGTELLLGTIVDTNAAYLGRELATLGIDNYYISAAGDNLGRLTETLRRAWQRSDLIVITGGLGPTEDDLSREAMAALLDEPMEVQPELERQLRAFFARRSVVMPERNVKQATLVRSATAIANPVGTAPGWWVERDGRVIVAMPGVPSEMMRMWSVEVKPRLQPLAGGMVIFSRTLKVSGIGESSVEELLGDLVRSTAPTVATYAKRDGIHVRLTVKAPDPARAEQQIAPMEARIREILGAAVYGVDEETPAQGAAQLLAAWGLALGIVEAGTAGAITAELAAVLAPKQFAGSRVLAAAAGGEAEATELAAAAFRMAEEADPHPGVAIPPRQAGEGHREQLASTRGRMSDDPHAGPPARPLGASAGEGDEGRRSAGIGLGVAIQVTQEEPPAATVSVAVASEGGVRSSRRQYNAALSQVRQRAVNDALGLLRAAFA